MCIALVGLYVANTALKQSCPDLQVVHLKVYIYNTCHSVVHVQDQGSVSRFEITCIIFVVVFPGLHPSFCRLQYKESFFTLAV